jgi:hypothetical protein
MPAEYHDPNEKPYEDDEIIDSDEPVAQVKTPEPENA